MRRPITRRDGLAVLAGSVASLRFGSAAGFSRSSPAGKKRPPNFVVFMTDDQRELGDSDPPGPPPVARPCEIPA